MAWLGCGRQQQLKQTQPRQKTLRDYKAPNSPEPVTIVVRRTTVRSIAATLTVSETLLPYKHGADNFLCLRQVSLLQAFRLSTNGFRGAYSAPSPISRRRSATFAEQQLLRRTL